MSHYQTNYNVTEAWKQELLDRIRAEVVASDISPSALRTVMDILRRVEQAQTDKHTCMKSQDFIEVWLDQIS